MHNLWDKILVDNKIDLDLGMESNFPYTWPFL